jgi:hypothetical protein
VNAIPNIATAIVAIVANSVVLLPILSPTWPNMNAAIGRAKKVAAYVETEAVRAATGL